MPAIAGVSFIAAGILVAVGVGAMLWSLYGPRPRTPAPVARPDWRRPAAPTVRPFTGPPQELAAGVRAATIPPSMPTPAWMPWTFGRIDFGSEQAVQMIFNLNTGLDQPEIAVADFIPHAWTPELFSSGLFNPGRPDDHGVAWLDDAGRVGLWLHSGTGEAAWEIQELLERDQHGRFRQYQDAQPLLDQYVTGSQVELYQADAMQIAYIAVAIRVGPQDVAELQRHVMDLAEHLGFANQLYTSDVLMVYFCGRLLNGEGPYRIPNESPWQQARFVLALVPALSND